MSTKINVMPGDRFGKLVVTKESLAKGYDRRYFELICDCGNIVTVVLMSLRSGDTKSCGCINKLSPPGLSHKMSKTNIYKRWCGMLSRCSDTICPGYKNYAGRGIKVCDKWLKFENFYEDMGKSFKEGLSLERIDVNGNYCKKNCKWIPINKQGLNKRNNRIIKYNGKSQPLSQWSKEIGIKMGTLHWRICVAKWPLEKALSSNMKINQFK